MGPLAGGGFRVTPSSESIDSFAVIPIPVGIGQKLRGSRNPLSLIGYVQLLTLVNVTAAVIHVIVAVVT